MKRLKTILHSNGLLLFLFLIVLLSTWIRLCLVPRKSMFSSKEKNFTCVVQDKIGTKDNRKWNLSCPETVEGIYYGEEEIDEKIRIGDILQITGTLESWSPTTNPNLFSYKDYQESKGIFYQLEIESFQKVGKSSNWFLQARYEIEKRIEKLDCKAYLEALLLGKKDNLEKEMKTKYQNVGIIHLFAISGMHVGVILAIVSIFWKKEGIIKYICCSVFLLCYYKIVGNVSLFRALLFYVVNTGNKIFHLEISKPRLLFGIVSILLLWNPYYLFQSSFWYSILISGTLFLESDKLKNSSHKLAKIFQISWIAFLVSFPLTIYNYFQVNLLSSLYNLLVVPLTSMFLFPLSLLTFLFPIMDVACAFSFARLEELVSFWNEIPSYLILAKPTIFILVLYYVVIFLSLWKKKYLVFLSIMVLIHANYCLLFPRDYLLFIDVSQGDSLLIHSGGNNILVDTGGKETFGTSHEEYTIAENITIPLLKSLGITKLDYLILTHGDADHAKEAKILLENYPVQKVYLNQNEYNQLEQEIVSIAKKNNIEYEKIGFRKTIFPNFSLYSVSYSEQDENDSSIINYLELNGYKILLAGDISSKIEEKFLRDFPLYDIDILKVAHHGSLTSSSISFLEQLNPRYSVISVGKNNRYGHPNKEVLERLQYISSFVYRTDEMGAIWIDLKKKGNILQNGAII